MPVMDGAEFIKELGRLAIPNYFPHLTVMSASADLPRHFPSTTGFEYVQKPLRRSYFENIYQRMMSKGATAGAN